MYSSSFVLPWLIRCTSSANFWSSFSWDLSLFCTTLENPHLSSKHSWTIISSGTSSQASLIHLIACKKSTYLAISGAVSLWLTCETTNFRRNFLYHTLKFLITPASRDWSLDVVSGGRKTTFMYENISCRDILGCQGIKWFLFAPFAKLNRDFWIRPRFWIREIGNIRGPLIVS